MPAVRGNCALTGAGAALNLTRVTLPPVPEIPLRTSHPTLVAASRTITAQREAMVTQWIAWLGDRLSATSAIPCEVVRQELMLLIDVFASMIGPMRRETKIIWLRASELYGNHAAMRGLAAGEVVEEMQYLRELLIRHLAPAIAALRPRQGMALLLRLNRLVDRGVAMAVVGYTDALVQSLLPGSDDRPATRAPDPEELTRSISRMRTELVNTVTAQNFSTN